MRFCLLAVALLGAIQASQGAAVSAEVSTTAASSASWESAAYSRLQTAQAAADAALAAARNFVVDGVAAVATGAVEVVSAAIDLAQKQVAALVDEAQADGVAAAECGIAATASLAKISTNLPVAITHCLTDNLNVFDTYVQKIKADFLDIAVAIPTAVHDSAECWVFVGCQAGVYLNLTAFEAKKTADVAFQLLQIETAKINLVATVTKCDVEKKTQALLDVALVTPQAVACIAKKRAEIKSQS